MEFTIMKNSLQFLVKQHLCVSNCYEGVYILTEIEFNFMENSS